MYTYSAFVTNVVDGDTFDAVVDLGFHVKIELRFRLLGVDTAELRSKDKKEKELALEAKKEVESLILNQTVLIKTEKTGSFGRWLAEVFPSSINQSLNRHLLEKSLAKKY